MKRNVQSSTALALLVVSLVAMALPRRARAQTFAADVTDDRPPHPALALGVGDLVLAAAMIPAGIGVGVGVEDNGWEKASTLIGAGLGLGTLGAVATAHGVADGDRRLKDPIAAGFGWFFTSLSAGGVGAGVGLLVGGEEAGKPIGGVIAASSLIFLAPGIPLIADGESSSVKVPAPSEWGRPPAQNGWAVPAPSPEGGWVQVPPPVPYPTRLNSAAMVGVGSVFLIVGGLGSIVGLAGVAIGANIQEEGVTALGGGVLAAGLGTALVGLPLVIVGAKEVPDVSVTAGPGGIGLSGSF